MTTPPETRLALADEIEQSHGLYLMLTKNEWPTNIALLGFEKTAMIVAALRATEPAGAGLFARGDPGRYWQARYREQKAENERLMRVDHAFDVQLRRSIERNAKMVAALMKVKLRLEQSFDFSSETGDGDVLKLVNDAITGAEDVHS